MAARNPLEATLTTQVQECLGSDWTVIAIAGDAALKPIEKYLTETFDVEQLTGTVVVICRRENL